MKSSFRKIMAFLLAVIMLLGLAACSNGKSDAADSDGSKTGTSDSEAAGSENKEPVTLTLLANQDWVSKQYMKNIWALYEEKTGNKLDIQVVPIDSGETVMKTKFATGEIPDVFMHFGGYSLAAYNPEENFVDFSDAEWVSDIQSYIIDQVKYDGKVYGLPFWEAAITGCVYNKEVFDQFGLEVPTTQTEFEAVCDELLANGVTPIYMAFKDVWPLLQQLPMDVMVKDPDTLAKLNSNQITYADLEGMPEMLGWYQKMAEKGYLGDMYTTNTWDGGAEALASGEYAMMYVWDSWVDTDMTGYEDAVASMGFMPAFLGYPEQGTFEGPNVCMTFANKNSEHVEEAIEFINFMADPDNYNAAFDGFGTAPVFNGQTTNITTPLYQENVELIEKVSNSSIAVNSIIGFTQVDGGKYIQELMTGSISVEECIKGMDEDRIAIAAAQQVEGFVE